MEDGFVPWPFPVLKPETDWDQFDRDFLGFMRVAFAEGFRPRHQQCSAVAADSPAGRSAFLVFRGRRNGWEPWLGEGDRSVRLGPHYGLLLGESARERADVLAALKAVAGGETAGPSVVDAIRRALVEALVHGDRPRLVEALDDALLGLRPRPTGYFARLASAGPSGASVAA